MEKLIVIRHSEAVGQHKDSPLTKLGNRQSQALARFMEQSGVKVDRIICSPFLRAIDTIKPYALKHNLSIETDDRLMERILSHEPLDDWEEVLRDSFQDPDLKVSGGESSMEARERVWSLIHELENTEQGNVVLVTHGNLLALLLQKYNREIGFYHWKRLSNPDVFVVQKQGGEFVVERIWDADSYKEHRVSEI